MDAVPFGVYYTQHTRGRDAMGSKELIKLLERAGFKLIGVNGSHHKYRNSANLTVIVPHPKKDLPPGTLAAIKKQAGL